MTSREVVRKQNMDVCTQSLHMCVQMCMRADQSSTVSSEKNYEAHTLVLMWGPWWKYGQNKGKRSKRKGSQVGKGGGKVSTIWSH